MKRVDSSGGGGKKRKRTNGSSNHSTWRPQPVTRVFHGEAAWLEYYDSSSSSSSSGEGTHEKEEEEGDDHDHELLAFYKYVMPREVELRARRAALGDFQRALRAHVRGWGAVKLQVFGSFAEACRPGHIFTSDIDVEVVGVPGFFQEEKEKEDKQDMRDKETSVVDRLDEIDSAGAGAATSTSTSTTSEAVSAAAVSAITTVEATALGSDGGLELHVQGASSSSSSSSPGNSSAAMRPATTSPNNAVSKAERQREARAKGQAVAMIGNALRRCPACDNHRGGGGGVLVIRHARVPLCTAWHVSGVEVDLTVGLSTAATATIAAAAKWSVNTTGANNKQQGFAFDKDSDKELLAPLVAVLKIFLSQQGLLKGSDGGVGSFRLYVLASAFLDSRTTASADAGGSNSSNSSNGSSGGGLRLDRYLLVGLFEWAAATLPARAVVQSRGKEVSFEKHVVSKLPQIVAALAWAAARLREPPSSSLSPSGSGSGSRSGSESSSASWLARVIDSVNLRRERARSLDAATIAEQRQRRERQQHKQHQQQQQQYWHQQRQQQQQYWQQRQQQQNGRHRGGGGGGGGWGNRSQNGTYERNVEGGHRNPKRRNKKTQSGGDRDRR
jgi:predicted nucleotidyltransferase